MALLPNHTTRPARAVRMCLRGLALLRLRLVLMSVGLTRLGMHRIEADFAAIEAHREAAARAAEAPRLCPAA
ncbi:hypothetical protein [Mycetocola spongiae]|uniref:hypothetical protein n=1 Tax=Mycetocola spongiae TaxID=2859226 RepID=UPI001CF3BE54|nr:hypothetical protein [Mycetocola spongiae]UCR88344.1 hypothetical protein KXZ72_10235 [Mycetocola spongiae]